MGKIYFISDLHLNHDREFIYKPRGFNTVYEMNDTIIKNWNSIVNMEDDIYVLGDLMLGNNEVGISLIKQLKGNIHVVRGNHDTDVRMELYNNCYNIVEITEGQFFKYNGYHFYLNHFPCLCSNFDDKKPLQSKIINLCGHSHVNDAFADFNKGLIFHCEMDTNNCYPWDIENIIKKILDKSK